MSSINSVNVTNANSIPHDNRIGQEKLDDLLKEANENQLNISKIVEIEKRLETILLGFNDDSLPLASKRKSLRAICSVKEEDFPKVKTKALDMLADLLEDDPLTPDSAIGIIDTVDYFYNEMTSENFKKNTPLTQIKMARVYAYALEVLLENEDHLNAIPQTYKENLKKVAEGAEKLNHHEDPESTFLLKRARKASRVLSSDAKKLDRFIAISQKVSDVISKAYDKDLSGVFKALTDLSDEIDNEKRSRWFASALVIKKMARHILREDRNINSISLPEGLKAETKKIAIKNREVSIEKQMFDFLRNMQVVIQKENEENFTWEFCVKSAEIFCWIGRKATYEKMRRAVIIGEGNAADICLLNLVKRPDQNVDQHSFMDIFRQKLSDLSPKFLSKDEKEMIVTLLSIRPFSKFLNDPLDLEIHQKVCARLFEVALSNNSKIKKVANDFLPSDQRERAELAHGRRSSSSSTYESKSDLVPSSPPSNPSVLINEPIYLYFPLLRSNSVELELKIIRTIKSLEINTPRTLVVNGTLSDTLVAALGEGLKSFSITQILLNSPLTDDQANILARAIQVIFQLSKKVFCIQLNEVKNLNLLAINLRNLDSADLALSQLDFWESSHPGYTPGVFSHKGRIHEDLGNSWKKQNTKKKKDLAMTEFKKAEKFFKDELAHFPNSVEAMTGLARMKWLFEEYKEAISHASKALSLDLDNPIFNYNLARYYHFILNEFDTRKGYLESSLQKEDLRKEVVKLYEHAIKMGENWKGDMTNEKTRSNMNSINNILSESHRNLEELKANSKNIAAQEQKKQ